MAIATQPTGADVAAFIDSVADPGRREEARTLRAMMERVTGRPAVMWGTSIVGFGSFSNITATDRYDWFVVGFSPRKAALTLYGVYDAAEEMLLADLGPHSTGKGCLYVKRMSAVDSNALERLIQQAWRRRMGGLTA